MTRSERTIIRALGRVLTVALFAYLAVGFGTAYGGKNSDQALRIYKRGMVAYKAADYRGAIALFEQALTLQRHKNILYYLGEAHRRLGRLREAHAYYSRYAKLVPAAIQKRLASKLRALRFGKPSQVSIATQPGGAKVLVDGRAHGTTPKDGSPLSLRIGGGKHRLRVTHLARRPVDTAITVEFAEPLALSFALPPVTRTRQLSKANSERPPRAEHRPLGAERDIGAEPKTAPTGRPVPATVPVNAGGERVRLRDVEGGRDTSLLVLGLGSGALAVASLVTALVYTNKYNDSYTTDPNLVSYGRLAVGGYIAAGVLGAGCSALLTAYALSGLGKRPKRVASTSDGNPKRVFIAPVFGGAAASITAVVHF